MGMSSKLDITHSSSQDILATLETAEKFFWANLATISQNGSVLEVRDAEVVHRVRDGGVGVDAAALEVARSSFFNNSALLIIYSRCIRCGDS